MVAHTRTQYSYVDIDISGYDFSTTQKRDATTCWLLKALAKGELTSGTIGYTNIAPSTAHWTCAGSSDGVTAGMDGVDRWGPTFDTSKLVFAGGPRSWLVLQSPPTFTDGPIYILFHLAQVFTGIGCQMSVTPFTGGDINTPPTSTTFRNMSANDAYFQLLNTGAGVTNLRAHFTTDSEGHFHFYMSQNGSGQVNGYFTVSEISQGARATDSAKWGLFWYPGNLIPNQAGYWNYFTRLVNQWHRLSVATFVGGNRLTFEANTAVASDGLVQLFPAFASIDSLTDGGGLFATPLDWGIKGQIRDQYRGFAMALGAAPATGPVEQIHLVNGHWIPSTVKPNF